MPQGRSKCGSAPHLAPRKPQVALRAAQIFGRDPTKNTSVESLFRELSRTEGVIETKLFGGTIREVGNTASATVIDWGDELRSTPLGGGS